MFFFFKQKTAYEMRISDWSSDVCSSDLPPHKGVGGTPMSHLTQSHSDLLARSRRIAGQVGAVERALLADKDCAEILHLVAAVRGAVNGLLDEIIVHHLERSEEHTSKLQSLMRISYAVFCLKKKKHNTRHINSNHTTKKLQRHYN